MNNRFVLTLGVLIVSVPALCQQQPSANNNVKLGDVTVSGWLRSRGEIWDWFQGNANNQYAYSESIFRLSFAESSEKLDWKLELAVPVLLGLPNDAIAPGAQGQFGFGASYYAANDKTTNAAMIFPKQAFVRFKLPGGHFKQTLQVGRMEFRDGAEVTPKNATLAILVRDRIAERLIGNFGFSDVGRSFDGVEYSVDGATTNFTLLAARPTRGVFQVDGWGEVKTNVFYGGLNHQVGSASNAGQLRIFAIGYNDYRDGVVKTDNRGQAVRQADGEHINIATVGANYIHAIQTQAGTFDGLLWGAFQAGSWGKLSHRAGAYAVEAGWQPRFISRVKPWVRGGFDYGSGDKNPNDGIHGTFFQILPTPRPYARFPFFNLMNNRDAFGELILRPRKSLVIRTDLHGLWLASANDLWYSGGGVYQPWTFGYVGRPSNGHSGLATLYDASADYTLNAQFAFGAYYGHASGKLVAQALYPAGANANFGLIELNYRF